MVLKTRSNTSGFTIVEIIIVVGVLTVLFSVAVLLLDPIRVLKDGRDNKRLSDLSLIDRVITEYKVDTGSYPGAAGTVYYSNILPAGGSALANANAGWIPQVLTQYTSRLPLDPINTVAYRYTYTHNAETYELNAMLESRLNLSQNDGGNNSSVYEIGNNLNLISF